MLKTLIFTDSSRGPGIDKMTWASINRAHKADCCDVLALIDLILTLPASTAECERGFNVMKQIKNDWRSSLGADSLNDLMTVLLVSPPIADYNPERAVELWQITGTRSRRPSYKENIRCESEEEDVGSDEEFVYIGLSRALEATYEKDCC